MANFKAELLSQLILQGNKMLPVAVSTSSALADYVLPMLSSTQVWHSALSTG